MTHRPARFPVRLFLIPIVLASLGLAVSPTAHVAARGPVPVAAAEVALSIGRERTFSLPIAASHVALHWRGEASARLTVAFSPDGVTFGPAVDVDRDEVGEGRGNGETYGNVLLADGARFVRVTSDRPLPRLSVLAMDSRGLNATSVAIAPVAAAAVTQPAVTSRAGWGADETLRFDAQGREKWTPVFQPVQKLIVHHTATANNDPDPASTVRAIYYYDAITQGWGDMGYNFLIDEAGRIYEGRYTRVYASGETPTEQDTSGRGVTGAHAVNYNSGTVGIALLGTLTNRDATPAARDSLARLLAWIAGNHGLDPHGSALYVNPVSGLQATFANIAGHRDVAATECPGGSFYATLPTLRNTVAALIAGSPTPSPTQVPTPTPSPTAGATPTLAPTPSPDFSMSMSPLSRSVRRGAAGSYTVTITSTNGYNASVQLSVTGLPVGTTAAFVPNPVANGAGTATLSVQTSTATPVGTYVLTINGAGGVIHSITVTLRVTKK